MPGSPKKSPKKTMSPKKAASPKKKVKKAKKPAAHPSVVAMVSAAIAALKDRKGSSLAAIKKYIAANYKVNMVAISPFIKRCLKAGVAKGTFKQASGTGASGRFRLGKAPAPKKKKAKKAKKAKKPKKAKKAKKTKKAKKPKAKKAKKPKVKKAKKAKKSVKKATKAKKPKAKKAKKPKAKKAAKAKK